MTVHRYGQETYDPTGADTNTPVVHTYDRTKPSQVVTTVVVGAKVRKQHPYDGSRYAGRPFGPVLTVKSVEPHKPADGLGSGTVVHFVENNDWAFAHNLHVIQFNDVSDSVCGCSVHVGQGFEPASSIETTETTFA